MYKRVSTALYSPGFRLLLSALSIIALTAFATKHWHLLAALVEGQIEVILFTFLLVFPLTALNLYAEVRKWLALLNARDITLRQGFMQVLSGMCSGFVTPNRIGEFAGRLTYTPKGYHGIAPAAAISGSVVQGMVTAWFGVIGVIFSPILPGYIEGNVWLTLIVIVIALSLLSMLFFRDLLNALRKRFSESYVYFVGLKRNRLARVVGWAVLRYLVFSTQFVAVLFCFGFEGSVFLAYTGVFLLYFCQSFIPGPAMGELGVRELLALVIFGSFFPHAISAVLCGLMVWVTNIGVPILAGVSIMGFSLRHDRS